MAVKRDETALILALARGEGVPAAAKAAGLAERTARRRANDPDFRQQVSRVRCDLLARAAGILADQSTAAARTLADLLSSPSETVRLRAAVALLDSAMKAVEASDVADRVIALEEALANNLFETQPDNSWRK
jgi:hypothetical protein